MSLNSTHTQIKAAYETNDMSPEEIAVEMDFELVAVKSILMQISAKYRRDCGHESPEVDKLNFSDEQLERVNEVIYELAVGAEDPFLRAKMACYVRDDKKGRKEVVKAVQQTGTFNMMFLNDAIVKAREMADKTKEKLLGNKEVIEA